MGSLIPSLPRRGQKIPPRLGDETVDDVAREGLALGSPDAQYSDSVGLGMGGLGFRVGPMAASLAAGATKRLLQRLKNQSVLRG